MSITKQSPGRNPRLRNSAGKSEPERSNGGDGYFAYTDAIARTYRTGKENPFLYDTVWDVLRLLDYLETRDDVDAQHIGLIGFSKGGMETYLAAAVDKRIAVAIPFIGVQSFRWALDNNGAANWTGYDNDINMKK